MKDFKYCIWLSPDNEHIWNTYIDFKSVHCSLETNISKLANIIYELNIIKKNFKPIKIELSDDLIFSEEDGFYAAYYKIKKIDNSDFELPENAHISFVYGYDKNIFINKVKNFTKNIKNNNFPKTAILNNINIVNCHNHYNNWDNINIT